MTKKEILDYIFKSKDGASWNEVSEMLNEFKQQAIADHEAVELKIRLRQFSNFVEHRYPMNASGIPFSKAVELYLERINPTPYKDKQKGGER